MCGSCATANHCDHHVRYLSTDKKSEHYHVAKTLDALYSECASRHNAITAEREHLSQILKDFDAMNQVRCRLYHSAHCHSVQMVEAKMRTLKEYCDKLPVDKAESNDCQRMLTRI